VKKSTTVGFSTRSAIAALVSFGLVLGVIPVMAVGAASAQEVTTKKTTPPNFVVIQTDDMIVDDLAAMPGVKALLGAKGATFEQALTPFALCCPSRAALMTGCYPHNNGISANFPPAGGFVPWEKKNGDKFTAYWLKEAGYYTGHIGKYINGYGMYNRRVPRIPSGWSEWHGTSDPSTYQMYGYRMNSIVNGKVKSKVYGDFYVEDEKNYLTDVETKKAVSFLGRQKKHKQPFFLQVAYLAPHVETVPMTDGSWKDSWADVDKPEAGSGIDVQSIPPRPALRHQKLLPNLELPKDPSFNELDRSDKHPFIRAIPQLTDQDVAELTADNRSRKLSLLAVDEGVTAIVAALKKNGQLDNTYIVFMGDNGYILGQHAIRYGKYFPYEPALRIPMIIRGPGIKPNTVITDPVFEIDITPTVLELAGVKPTRPVDGVSLLARMQKGTPLVERTLLLSSGPQKSASGTDLPLFDGVRTSRYVWWIYEDGFEEMYDLEKDPYQLESVANNPAYTATKQALVAQWNTLKTCSGTSCQAPTPNIPGPTQ
jgi:N-acetylglucosamine-6-sulfatase